MTVDVTAVSDAPTAASETVVTLEDHTHTFSAAEFSAHFSDATDAGTDVDSFAGILITSLPANGTLAYNGTALTAADLGANVFAVSAPHLGLILFPYTTLFRSPAYASFGFKAQDD